MSNRAASNWTNRLSTLRQRRGARAQARAHAPARPCAMEGLEPRALLAALPHVSFFPEGFVGNGVSEFVPMMNPNAFPVNYELWARYETGERDQLVASGSIGSQRRGGVTLAYAPDPSSIRVRVGTPFALELRASAPLAAQLSHYDFGTAIGKSFTSRTDTSWSFANGFRDNASTRQFVLVYNPGATDALVTLQVFTAQGVREFQRTVESLRRGGWSINDIPGLPDGSFGMRVVSSVPIVSSLSHYEIISQRGDATLGTPGEGVLAGFLPVVEFKNRYALAQDANDSPTADPRPTWTGNFLPDPGDAGLTGDMTPDTFNGPDRTILSVFNPGSQAATVLLSFSGRDGAQLSGFDQRTITVAAQSRRGISVADLGFGADAEFAVLYEASTPVVVSATVFQGPDAITFEGGDIASTTWTFGEGFMNRERAGVSIMENIYISNPTDFVANVTLDFLMADGQTRSVRRTVYPLVTEDVEVHRVSRIAVDFAATWYGVRIISDVPVVAFMEHWDDFQGGGGFATQGRPGGEWYNVWQILPN